MQHTRLLQFMASQGCWGCIRSGCLRQSWKPSPTGLFTFHLIPLPPAALSHCRFRTSLGSVRSALPASRGCSCCCHHPTTSGTRGLGWHCGPHQVLGSDPTPGPFHPVSGCGYTRGQRELRRDLVTMYAFPSEFKEETVARLPPLLRENPCAPSHHIHPRSIFELKHEELTVPWSSPPSPIHPPSLTFLHSKGYQHCPAQGP
ncbi:uncharacterized protein LOC129137248 [Pan troglodytes]|uniref:uncharacterized protein LOC129137248 n=1 Tax=Pan troglodytes TaxID=9598 RepID=UPI00051227A0|nr:uncharacterized protein LOC129137248 [Pan troglodytes]